MKIKRKDKSRLKNRDSHEFFKGNNKLWASLVEGNEIEIPDIEGEGILAWFNPGLIAIVPTKPVEEKRSNKV